jgi:hypothetical protein
MLVHITDLHPGDVVEEDGDLLFIVSIHESIMKMGLQRIDVSYVSSNNNELVTHNFFQTLSVLLVIRNGLFV